MERPLIEITNLKKHYPLTASFLDRFSTNINTVKALNGINLKIRKGETLGLVGESGCGKSTLGKILVRLEEPTEGLVRYNGRGINTFKKRAELKELRKRLQIVFQNPASSLDPRMTAKQILMEPLKIHFKLTKKELTERINDLMEMVGLNPGDVRKFSGEFSDGQKQRIAFVRALSLNPEFIVADEPVSALDVSVQAQILNLIKRLQKKMNLTILFISHDLQVVQFLSSRIAVIYLGKIVELGSTKDFFENPLHPYSEGLLSATLDLTPEMDFDRFRIIADVPVSQMSIPSGCVFRQKCPETIERCATTEPVLKEIRNGHFVACLRR